MKEKKWIVVVVMAAFAAALLTFALWQAHSALSADQADATKAIPGNDPDVVELSVSDHIRWPDYNDRVPLALAERASATGDLRGRQYYYRLAAYLAAKRRQFRIAAELVGLAEGWGAKTSLLNRFVDRPRSAPYRPEELGEFFAEVSEYARNVRADREAARYYGRKAAEEFLRIWHLNRAREQFLRADPKLAPVVGK